MWLGTALTFDTSPISTLWPPNAVLLAALLLTPPRRWWIAIVAVAPAHFLMELTLGVPFKMAACWYVSNTVEALLGASLVLRYLGRRPRFDLVNDLFAFMIAAGVIAPALSSFLDVGFVAWVGWRYGDFWYLWRTRTLSNSLAALTIVPLLLTLVAIGWQRLRTPGTMAILEHIALVGGLCLTSAIVFTHPHPLQHSISWLCAPVPFLLWAALRGGIGSVSLCIMLTAMFAIEGVVNGRGPFTAATPEEAVRAVQIYLLIACPSMMLLAASLTELNAARATAERQAEKLNLALEAAQMRVWEWDMANNLVIRVRSRAPARVQSLYKLLDRVHPDDRETLTDAIAAVSERGKSGEVEFRLRGRHGGTRWISSRGKMLCDSRGKPLRVIAVCSDSTRRNAQETQLVAQREQIARLNKVALLGELSAVLAHELKQPLAAILSNAQAAKRVLGARKPNLHEVQDILSDIIAENRRTLAVLERLRALFTRETLQAQAASANACIRDSVLLERSALDAHGITLHTELEDGLPLAAIGQVELQQVLINLIVNARDALEQNPRGHRRISIRTQAREDGVELQVHDNGPGLTHPESVFGAFFTTKPEGLGLGLSICRTIITARGGRLTAHNAENGGAMFNIWLPAFREQMQPRSNLYPGALDDGDTGSFSHAQAHYPPAPPDLLRTQASGFAGVRPDRDA